MFLPAWGKKISSAWSTERINVSFNECASTMTNGNRTCLIQHIDNRLRVVPREAMDIDKISQPRNQQDTSSLLVARSFGHDWLEREIKR